MENRKKNIKQIIDEVLGMDEGEHLGSNPDVCSIKTRTTYLPHRESIWRGGARTGYYKDTEIGETLLYLIAPEEPMWEVEFVENEMSRLFPELKLEKLNGFVKELFSKLGKYTVYGCHFGLYDQENKDGSHTRKFNNFYLGEIRTLYEEIGTEIITTTKEIQLIEEFHANPIIKKRCEEKSASYEEGKAIFSEIEEIPFIRQIDILYYPDKRMLEFAGHAFDGRLNTKLGLNCSQEQIDFVNKMAKIYYDRIESGEKFLKREIGLSDLRPFLPKGLLEE